MLLLFPRERLDSARRRSHVIDFGVIRAPPPASAIRVNGDAATRMVPRPTPVTSLRPRARGRRRQRQGGPGPH